MGCNSGTKFYYSDDVYICTLYRQYDSWPKEHLNAIAKIINDDCQRNVQWDSLVYHILVNMRRPECSRLRMTFEASEEDKSVDYVYIIKPIEEKWVNRTLPFVASLYIKIVHFTEIEYEGVFSEYLKILNDSDAYG